MNFLRLANISFAIVVMSALWCGCGKNGGPSTTTSQALTSRPSLPGLTNSLDPSCASNVQQDLKQQLSAGNISSSPSSYKKDGKTCRAVCIEAREGPDLFSSSTGALFDFQGNSILSCPDDVSDFLAIHTSTLCGNREFSYRFRYECPPDVPVSDEFSRTMFDCGNGTKVSGVQIKQEADMQYANLQTIYSNLRSTVDVTSRIGEGICPGYPSDIANDGVTFNPRCQGIKVEVYYRALNNTLSIVRIPDNTLDICLRTHQSMSNCPNVIFEAGGTRCQ